MSIADRIEKLVMLASSPNENEARTAAVIACKLIREHGLLVVDREPVQPRVVLDDERIIIRSRYLGRCAECACRINVGDSCAWARGRSVLCVGCHREERQAA
jgi:hypothetical protein